MTLSAARSDVAFEVSASTLAWVGAGLLFIGLRLAGMLSIPVGGPELAHLSGAWQAHAGNDDPRFVASLFQALTAWSFEFTISETPARLLVLVATASVPFALYRVRDWFGEAAALSALVLLAFDPVSILIGSTAWAGALDVPIVLWLLVLTREERRPGWIVGLGGFALSVAGPIVLPFALAFGGVKFARQQYPARATALWLVGGALGGAVAAAAQFGFGFHDPVLPSLALFIQGFEDPWSSETTRYLAMLYSGPLLALAIAAAVYRAYACWRDDDWPDHIVLVLAAFALCFGWVVVAGGAHDPVPLGAFGLAAALVLGHEVPVVFEKLRTVYWLLAGPILTGMLVAALVAEAFVVDWARMDRVGTDRDKMIVTALVVAVVAAMGILLSNRRTAASLLVIPPLIAVLPMLSGTFGVAFGGPNEPLPSPISTVQGREVRDIAVAVRTESGGQILVHADFEEEMTWPFRDSGEILVASQVPPDASVVIWPTTAPAPDGYAVLDGNWSLQEERFGPSDGFLDYLRWLTRRNSLPNTPLPVAIYLRTSP